VILKVQHKWALLPNKEIKKIDYYITTRGEVQIRGIKNTVKCSPIALHKNGRRSAHCL